MSDMHESTLPTVPANAEWSFVAPVHELFDRHVATSPDAVALVCDDRSLTYRELDARANQLARHLRRIGVRAETTVGLVLERDLDMIVAVLAVLKAGGAYVPLDSGHPNSRIAYILEDCGAAVVLTTEKLVDRLFGIASPIVCVDRDRWRWADSAADCLHVEVTRRDLAYVIYTSGSTGLPKGVLIEHGSLSSLLSSVQAQYGYGEHDRVFQFGSFSFDVAQQEIFSALLAGARLVLRSERQALDPAELLSAMEAQGITKAFFPTAYWHSFTAELAAIGAVLPTSLRLVLVAGEAMRPEMVALWQEHWGDGPELVNAYGPTEATIFATTFTVPPGWPREASVSIGRPLPHVTAYVLDAQGQPTPHGVTGELYLGGRQVARGYLNRPELTAQRFVPDAFGCGNGARLYRTGDLARTTPDGRFEYLGRGDSQVKIRGFRIELEEVESHVASLPGVRQAVVLARGDHLGHRILVAYVASSRGERLVPDHLREHLATRVPDYMVPSAFVVLDALPLTVNGKIDRERLPPPDPEASDRVLVAPTTPTERCVVEIVAEVLGRTRVGVTDSFLALGGHSLLAAQVAARMRARLRVELFVRDVLSISVLRELAAHIDSLDPSTAEQPARSIPTCPRGGRLRASHAQERLWFLDQLEAQGSAGRAHAYLMPEAFSMSGRLDVACLERALQILVDRHESLRTSLVSVEGVPMQVVASSAQLGLPLTDLGALPGPTQDEALQARLRRHRETAFDLDAGGLLRVELVRLGASSHVLLVTMHHIISDGWSMGVFMRELTALYSACVERAADPLPALTIQYADYAAWQRAELAPKLAHQLVYWERQLADLPVLSLPADRPRPPLETFAGSVHHVSICRELTVSLRQLGHVHDATLFMVTGAAFAILLGRYANQKEVVFGAPVANRTIPEFDGLIGLFVNSVVLRAGVDGASTYAALLRRFRSVCLEAYAHQDVPFEHVVRAINPDRSLARNPLFQVMFQLAADPYDGLRMEGVEVKPLGQDTRVAMFDLSVDLEERDGQLLAKLEYNTDLFDAATIRQMASQFEALLRNIVARPDAPAAELSMLTEVERARLLGEFAGTADDAPAGATIHELFEQQTARSPDAVAVVFDDQHLTYGDLNERANRFARHLALQGVGPEVLVVLALERGPDVIVAMLAVLKAGGAYVPVDPDYPAARVRHMLEDSNASVIVTQQAVLSRLPETRARTVCVDRDAAQWSDAPPADLDRLPAAGQLAYVIYTSGSTGLPKGAMIEYAPLSRHIAAVRSRYRLDANDCVFQFASFGFDVAGEEVFSALISGACLIVRSDRHELPAADLLRAWEQLGVTKVDLPTAYWHQLTAEAAALGCRLPGSLRLVVIGGEAARPDMVALWQQHWGNFPELVNAYGPTETTVTAMAYTLPPGWRPRTTVPLGAPFAGARAYILDQAGRPSPVGVPGELHVGGAHVGRGYLNRPELTAERFVPDPFAGGAHARLYKTGDLGRWLPDGNLEYLGRSDSQVKIRGFRIELREIESRLAEHPSVSEAVAIAREERPGDRRLVAYLVVAAGAEPPDPQGLRDHLRSQLPAHMIPSAFVALEALPLNANGKIDRGALPAPEYASFAASFEPPRSPTERAVADLFAEVLHVPRVAVSDNFFLLGGHSLLATQLVARVRERLHRDLLVRDLLSRPVVADLAAHLDAIGERPRSPAPAPIPILDRGQPLPTSFAQERLWFIDRLETQSTGRPSRVYLMPEAFALEGPLDVDALRRALQTIVNRHETLRTSLVTMNGTPMQSVAEERCFTLDVRDLSTLADAERRQALEHELRASAESGFELIGEFLFRASLVRLSAESHVFMFNIHHSVSDGWSIDVLMRELGALYSAYVGGRLDPLSTLPCQYADYAAWQRSSEQAALMSRQLSYWRGELADLPTLALPTDRSRPQVETFAGAVHRLSLSREMTARLKRLGHQEDATLFMTLGAAFAVLLGRYSDQTDVVFGVPTANRSRADVEGLIGLFVNTVVVRARLDGGPSFSAFLREFRQTCLRAQANQDVPFEHVVSALNPTRSASHNPLFQVMFQLLVAPREEPELHGLTVTTIAQETRASQFDLCLDLLEADGRVAGVFEYNTDLFDGSTIERMSRHFENLLSAVLADPTTAIFDLDFAGEAERHQVVFDFNAPHVAEPAAACVHELFERQAGHSPESPAMVFEDQRFTYGELNAEANRLARHLRSLGAAPGALVGLLIERDASVIVSMLAVLKTGAAYVAMDPKSPPDRIGYMLEDSSATIVLTNERMLEQLPRNHAATMICMDRDGASWSQCEASDLGRRVSLDSLAYAIYTSGSTGLPKGVLVQHRSVTNYICGYNARFALEARDRVFQFASFSFDVAGEEIYSTLVAGALLIVRSDRTSLEPPELLAKLAEWGVTKMDLPTAYWHQFTTELAARVLPPTLRLMITGGEAVRSEIVASWQKQWGDRPTLVNLYGPTETTMGVTSFQFPPGWRAEMRVPIGVPFSNNQAYVLDPQGRPAPLGVAGELHIGGAQVAQGYLNRPELTAEKFIPDPFGPHPQARLYRTGDLARWLPCGNLEYLGRVDSQVKIRGFRIELGEIESRLAAHPQVREVALMAREDQPGDKRLVAYVVPQRAAGGGVDSDGGEERVSLWKATHEDFHRDLGSDERGGERGGFAGWNSSYDGSPIPLDEMKAWRDATVARILELRPRRVLEVGTGTGLLLTELAPHCEAYYATDFSPSVLAYLRERILAHAEYASRVHLRHLEATDTGDLPEGWFDVVILNSVIQYFPSLEYLNRVLEQTERLLAADGVVFVGDVRNLRLHRQFRTAIEITRCAADAQATDTLLRIEHSLLSESELLIDPEFFAAHVARRPRLLGLDLRIRGERPHNELSRHRYDAVLRTKARTGADLSGVPTRAWPPGDDALERVRAILASERPHAVRLCGAPNARLAVENQVMRGLMDGAPVASLKKLLERGGTTAFEPDDLVVLGRELGYVAIVTWSPRGSDGALDVLFVDRSREGEEVSDPIGTYSVQGSKPRAPGASANTPRSKEELGDLVRNLRHYLGAHLPEYMMPSAFVILGALPLNDRAKIDFKALPPPRRDGSGDGGAEPATATEAVLAGLVAAVLGLERVGMEDNFFELGGHSLTATQLMSRVRSELEVELTLRDLFAIPQLRPLAAHIDGLEASRTDAGIRVLPRGEPLPASFAQERLWFIDRLETQGTGKRSSVYLMPDALLLEGALDHRCLVAALETIVERHETLRTAMVEIGRQVMQVIQPLRALSVPLTDLGALSGDEQKEAVELRIRELSSTGFDLDAGYLFRAELLRLGEQRHILLLSMHHIVSDGWSIAIVLREASELYSAFVAGKSSPLARLPIQYADYAAWQRTAAQAERVDQQLAYWRRQLSDLPLLALPTDRGRPAEESFAGAHFRLALPPELTTSLRDLAQANGASLFMALSAVFALMLGRQANQTDVVFGVPIANRTHRDLEGLIGFFVNTLVLRVRLEPRWRFVDLLHEVAQTCLQAFANQDLPFERLVSALNPARSLSRNPLFQVMFQLLTNPYERTEMAGLTVTPIEDSGATSKFDLALDVEEIGAGLVANFEYNTDLFDRGTIERMAKRFELLLAGIVAEPNARLEELPILDQAERQRVLVELNPPRLTTAPETCVHEVFEHQAAQFPDAVAVVCDDDTLTYGELCAHSNRLARHLVSLGVGPDVRVALLLQRGTHAIVSMLAVLKAGGAYVPMDPSYPPERILHILEDCGAPIVLTDEVGLVGAPRWPGTVVCVDRDAGQWADRPGTNLGRSVDPRSLAYVIYTSGSTGLPKGVLIEHRSLSSYIAAFTEPERYGLTRGDRVFQFASFTFDVSVEEIYSTLVVGAALILRSDRTPLEPRALLRQIAAWGVTKMDLPTAYWHQFTEELAQASIGMPPSVRLMVTGGEAVSQAGVVSWQRHFGERPRLVNRYGPTEATVGATDAELRAGFRAVDPVPIGTPYAGVRAYVLDRNGRPTPVGVPGELHLGGVQVARGYLNRPELTAEKFVPDPFTTEPSARMYRTGDFARWLANGNLECLGRIDSQVKIRGFRIELGEIQSRLAVHPRVREVTVIVREDQPGNKRLVAYVVPHEGSVTGADVDRTEEQVSLWKSLHDDSYSSLAGDADAFKGWNSSYDGQPLPIAEMQEWRAATVARILALEPRRAVEIGVGTGLLLREIAPRCEAYYGTDFSEKVIDYLEQAVLPAAPYASKVQLQRLDATDLGSLPLGSFDVVVINSVVQYFPSAEYLMEVLRQAERLLAPGGTIFVGDVRNLRLHRQFRTAVETFRGPATTNPTQLRLRIEQSVFSEIELLLDPDFFEAYAAQSARCSGVDIQIRRDECDNELSRHRYDVVLRTRPPTGPSLRELPVLAWGGDITSLEQLERHLEEQRPEGLRLTGVPNARLAHGVAAPSPADLYRSGESRSYHVAITWAAGASDGALDVVLVDRSRVEILEAFGTYGRSEASLRPPGAYANTPSSKGQLGELALTLRQYLAGHLPEYMVPSAVVVLGSLPLNDRGKVDTRALPLPEDHALERSYAAPQTPTEQALAVIFAKALGVERIGRNDNFFELGGHSLLAAQVVSSIRRDLRIAVPVRGLFTASSIAVLASQIDGGGFASVAPAEATRATGATQVLAPYDPVLSIQQGEPGSAPVFCVPGAGATIAYFAPLARSLGPDVAVYGLQPKGLDGESSPHSSVEEMARAYVAAIEAARVRAPIRLLGHSFGALVASEMASQMLSRGMHLDVLVLLDPADVVTPGKAPRKWTAAEALAELAEFIGESNECSLGITESTVRELGEAERIDLFRARLIEAGLISKLTPPGAIRGMAEVFETSINAAYRPSAPLTHPMVLMRAEEPDGDEVSKSWSGMAPQLSVIDSPGDHMSMLAEPHVAVLAGHIKRIWGIGQETPCAEE